MAITRPPLRVPRGFTLVEVLVTLAVIGLALGLVTLTLGHDSAAQLRVETDRLRSAIEHAGALAQWRRSDLTFEAVPDGYRFLHPAAEGRWEVETDELLSPHVLPAETRLSAVGPGGGAVTPSFRLRASGRNDPFTLVIEAPAGRWLIAADALNRVRTRLDSGGGASQ